ncbi:transcription factor btd-like [Cyclospora cayetanensis]|uniref:Transcription factor btd-like n=1 Tax=Cyclospora cayetanensis TaxID=88456 RepID=A0A6P6RZE6_9EIME|nr:transcription factor btd-like [Cyclospora cayetanensis]
MPDASEQHQEILHDQPLEHERQESQQEAQQQQQEAQQQEEEAQEGVQQEESQEQSIPLLPAVEQQPPRQQECWCAQILSELLQSKEASTSPDWLLAAVRSLPPCAAHSPSGEVVEGAVAAVSAATAAVASRRPPGCPAQMDLPPTAALPHAADRQQRRGAAAASPPPDARASSAIPDSPLETAAAESTVGGATAIASVERVPFSEQNNHREARVLPVQLPAAADELFVRSRTEDRPLTLKDLTSEDDTAPQLESLAATISAAAKRPCFQTSSTLCRKVGLRHPQIQIRSNSSNSSNSSRNSSRNSRNSSSRGGTTIAAASSGSGSSSIKRGFLQICRGTRCTIQLIPRR